MKFVDRLGYTYDGSLVEGKNLDLRAGIRNGKLLASVYITINKTQVKIKLNLPKSNFELRELYDKNQE